MTRRRATILLHWLNAALLLFLLASGGQNPFLAWAFAATALAMAALALIKGLMNGPGPKLEGLFRHAHPWLHRLIYVLLVWCALAVATAQTGVALPGPSARVALLTLLSVTLIHAIFHLWRHTALGDGALRRITPRAFHKVL